MVVMGRVAAPFGIKGWVKIHAYTEAKENLAGYPVWWLGKEGDWHEMRLAEYAVHGKAVVAQLEGCDDRSAAEALKGLLIAVPRALLPQSGKNEYYWADLIGLRVTNCQGETLGEVAEVLETGANDVLVVRGERERLLPFVAQVVLEVDVAARTMTVDWGSDY